MTAIGLHPAPFTLAPGVPILEGLSLRVSEAVPAARVRLQHARAWLRRATRVATMRLQVQLKRALDVSGAAVMLVALSPMLLLVALLIKLNDRGPVLFWQKRVGRWGQPFWFPKFRS